MAMSFDNNHAGIGFTALFPNGRQEIRQITLPDPNDMDPHPRILVDGEGIHAGMGFTALFPDGWHDITLEIHHDIVGPGCWYISTPGFHDICPIGLFVKW